MRFLFVGVAGILWSATSSCGQALNIDLAGVLGTPPSDTYEAASGQAGYWNSVGLEADLRDLSGGTTEAKLAANASGAIGDIPGAMGDDEKMMETVFIMPQDGNSLSVFGMLPGEYDLYVYCWGGSFIGPDTIGFSVRNGVDEVTGSVSFDSDWPGGHVEGVTYRRVRFDVLPEFRGFLMVFGAIGADFAVVNGLQLVPVPAPGAAVPLGAMACWASRRRR